MHSTSCLTTLVAVYAAVAATPYARAAEARERLPRLIQNLNAGWKFSIDAVEGAQTQPATQPARHPISLPHTWNNLDGQDGGDNYHRGLGTYRRSLIIPEDARGKRLFLRFGAANTVTDVYVNQRHVGQHRGGYAAFCFEITDDINFGATNDLVVKVDNRRFDDVPPWSADFTFFGGIYRDVELLVTEPVCVTPLDYASPGVYLRQRHVSDTNAEVEALVKVSNGLPHTQQTTLQIVVRDATGAPVARAAQAASIPAATTEAMTASFTINQPHLWSGRSDPYLYQVEVDLLVDGRLVDRVRQPLGLRSFSVDPDRGLILNGKHYDLHGVNRHQDRLDRGWAIGHREHEEDIDLITELGCTGVRLAHYQQDDYAYSLCDRAGLIVWAEIPLINRIVDSPAFRTNCRQQLIELIRQNYNHPSILFWGVHNEITAPWAPGPDATELVRELAELAKSEDSSRLTVCAATVPDEHSANWQTDVIAFNRYFGWYHDLPDGFAEWADRMHREHPDKPIGISEYGAGANIKHHEYPPQLPKHDSDRHPEEWQAHVHERHWLLMKERPYLWCTFVWNMFDFASDGRDEGGTSGRNDKGLVTYDRKIRKDAFFWYKSNWSDEPMVYITGRRNVDRDDANVEIRVYSNGDEVTLYVNDRSLGTQSREDTTVFTWPSARLDPGQNTIRAVARHKSGYIEDTCQWQCSSEH